MDAPRWESIRLPPGEYIVRLGMDGETAAVFEPHGMSPVKECSWPRAAQFVQRNGGEDLAEALAWRVTVRAAQ
jgi:hypothetical protein